jgi:ribosomal protein S27E
MMGREEPMAKHLRDDEFDTNSIVECTECGWRGRARDQVEFHDALFDVTCPECSRIILIVRYTGTHGPAETTVEFGRIGSHGLFARARPPDRYADAKARRIASPDDLPEIDAPVFTIEWDLVETPGGWSHWTVLRHDGREIAREPAFWEGIGRFEEVLDLLVRRYGARLLGLVPTDASRMYLYGDRLRAPGEVEALNAALPRSAR